MVRKDETGNTSKIPPLDISNSSSKKTKSGSTKSKQDNVGGNEAMIPKHRIKQVEGSTAKKKPPPPSAPSPAPSSSSIFSSRPPSSGMDRMTELAHDFEPTDLDVICARGKAAYNHSGNVRFREILEEHIPIYSSSTSKVEKGSIVSSIISAIRHASPNGGFVKEIDGIWYEVGDHTAREKVGQGFRDLLHTQYRSSTKAKALIRQRNQEKKEKEETAKRKALPKHHASVSDKKQPATPARATASSPAPAEFALSPTAPKTPASAQHPRKVISFTPASPSVASLPSRRIEDASPAFYRRSRIAPMMVTMSQPGRLIMTPTSHTRTMQQLPDDVPSLSYFAHRRPASVPPRPAYQHALTPPHPSSAPQFTQLHEDDSPKLRNRTISRASAALLAPPLTTTAASIPSGADPRRHAMVRTEHTEQTATSTISSEPEDTPQDGMDYWSSTMQVLREKAQYHPTLPPFQQQYLHEPLNRFPHSNLLDTASIHLPPAPPRATHHQHPSDPTDLHRSPGLGSLSDDRPISPIDLHHPLDEHHPSIPIDHGDHPPLRNGHGDDAGSCSSLSHDMPLERLGEALRCTSETTLEPLSRHEFLARTMPTDVTMVDVEHAPTDYPTEGQSATLPSHLTARALFHDVDEQEGDRLYSLEEGKSDSPSPSPEV